jgi:hypothetical protein
MTRSLFLLQPSRFCRHLYFTYRLKATSKQKETSRIHNTYKYKKSKESTDYILFVHIIFVLCSVSVQTNIYVCIVGRESAVSKSMEATKRARYNKARGMATAADKKYYI